MAKTKDTFPIKQVVYDTQEKVRAHWAFCDVLRQHGINTSDSKVVRGIRDALDAGTDVNKAFKQYRSRLLAD